MVETLTCYGLDEVFSDAYLVSSDVEVDGEKVVAVVLVHNTAGLTIYRHRASVPPEAIIKALGSDAYEMAYRLYEVKA